jgi:hypothetical protein
MNATIRKKLDELWSEDRQEQNWAFLEILAMTDRPVDWAYAAWDELVKKLGDKDNHNRAIAAQVLCGLAKSDPEFRLAKDFGTLLAVTRDARFVTARHCLQALWKVGAAGPDQQKLWMDGLAGRFEECLPEKNCTLIRYDIIESFRKVYRATPDEQIRAKAQELIETEADLKYRRKYASLWRK